jgi:hypothetical protein
MRRRPNSPTPFFGVLVERECPRCHRPVTLPIGQFCADCRTEMERRAERIARWVAGVTTVGMAVYVLVRVPDDPTARLVGIMSIGIWYLLTSLVVKRALRELLR